MPTLITPFAQTFLVDPDISPEGVFVIAVDLCFASKDNTAPVFLEIRPMVNGYPDINRIYYSATTSLVPSEINLVTGIGDDLPSFSDTTKYSRFVFSRPIYLPVGEHALVLKTNSINYEAYIAEMQEPIVGTTDIVSKQPNIGSLFRSQNATTWTPYQNQDLMFRIIRCKFDITTPSTVKFENYTPNNLANTPIDLFNVNVNDIVYDKTKLTYSYRATDTSDAMDSSNTAFQPKTNIIPDERKHFTENNASFIINTSLFSESDYVSPVVDVDRTQVIAIENYVNDGELSNSLISITNGGTAYNANSVPAVTIAAPTGIGGTTATAVANVAANGVVMSIVLTNIGSKYIETPTITIANTSSGNTNCAAVIIGETSKKGGNSLARYITRKAVLNQGFDATDLVVFLTANRPAGTYIEVYYKVVSAEDPDQNLDNKNWVLMVKDVNQFTNSKTENELIEYKYITVGGSVPPPDGPTGITYVSDGVTYNNFGVFAIKICLFSESTLVTPYVKDMRTIALL